MGPGKRKEAKARTGVSVLQTTGQAARLVPRGIAGSECAGIRKRLKGIDLYSNPFHRVERRREAEKPAQRKRSPEGFTLWRGPGLAASPAPGFGDGASPQQKKRLSRCQS